MPAGRPSKYDSKYHPKAAYKLCLLGAIDKELASFFEVNVDTVNEWKKVHKEFSVSLREGKLEADTKVADSLFQRACGYSHPEEKLFLFKGKIVRGETIRQYPPDTAAMIIWLKNRRPDLWRDKNVEINTDNSTHKTYVTVYLPGKKAARQGMEALSPAGDISPE